MSSRQPAPFHPQQKFGTGVQPAAFAYPNLAAYYGEQFVVHFTTLDLLDSLAARVASLEESREIMDGAVEDVLAIVRAARLPWYRRLWLRITGRSA